MWPMEIMKLKVVSQVSGSQCIRWRGMYSWCGLNQSLVKEVARLNPLAAQKARLHPPPPPSEEEEPSPGARTADGDGEYEEGEEAI